LVVPDPSLGISEAKICFFLKVFLSEFNNLYKSNWNEEEMYDYLHEHHRDKFVLFKRGRKMYIHSRQVFEKLLPTEASCVNELIQMFKEMNTNRLSWEQIVRRASHQFNIRLNNFTYNSTGWRAVDDFVKFHDDLFDIDNTQYHVLLKSGVLPDHPKQRPSPSASKTKNKDEPCVIC